MDNNLEIFRNEEFGEIRTAIIDNEPYFVGKDVAELLGYSNPQKAIRDHVDNEDKTLNELFTVNGTMGILINESGLYSLILSSKLPNAKKFKHWVTSEVLPSIRKHGAYMTEQVIEEALRSPDFLIQLATQLKSEQEARKLAEQKCKEQELEIAHKQEVINGFTDENDIYKKKDVINRICKRRSGNYANRYRELYRCFRENFHIDLEARCEGYNMKQNRKKDELSVIKYAEKFGYIDDLYSCCVKLYEAEIDEVLDQINSIHSNRYNGEAV